MADGSLLMTFLLGVGTGVAISAAMIALLGASLIVRRRSADG